MTKTGKRQTKPDRPAAKRSTAKRSTAKRSTGTGHRRQSLNSQLLRAFKKSKMSKYRLHKESGLGESTIGRWERGESALLLDNAESIAKALGIELRVIDPDDSQK